ncbi:MAG: CDP-alcohol phosphatidyltransferase family protein [Ignisphaera sp.]
MLGMLRTRVSKVVNSIAGHINVDPNAITFSGLAASFTSLVFAATGSYIFVIPVLVVVSGVTDVLDGAVARVKRKASTWGSIFDSFCDRVIEANYFISLMLLEVNHLLISLAIVVSFLISYLRALGEWRGVKLEGVGILEHGERMIIIFLSSLVIAIDPKKGVQWANILTGALVLLGIISSLQRLLTIYSKLHAH